MPFDKQPNLEGKTVRLRPLSAHDFDGLYAVASDPLLWALHPASNRYQRPVFQQLFDESIASGGAMVVIDKASGAIIGSSRYNMSGPASDKVEIGWSFLARSYWGGATNGEVKALLLNHAFRFVDTVNFRVGETNLRSRRAMEKIGGKLIDQRDELDMPDGTKVIHVIFQINRDNFLKSPLTSALR